MEDPGDALHRRGECLQVPQVAEHKLQVRVGQVQVEDVSRLQVVEDPHLVPELEQRLDEVAPDEARAAGDEVGGYIKDFCSVLFNWIWGLAAA